MGTTEGNRVEQARQLATFARARMADAEACAEIGRYYPACMMAGVSMEAVLLAHAYVFEPELREAELWTDEDVPLKWSIDQLIQRAVKMQWLPFAMKQVPNDRITEVLDGEAGDAVRFVQYLRNVTGHPGKHVAEVPWLAIGKTEWDLVQGIAGVVFGHLKERLDSLANHE